MPLPWERAPAGFDPLNLTPAPLPAPEEDDLPPDEPGFFTKWLLEPLGRPGSALRAGLSGEFGKAAAALTPFGESLGVYDPEKDYVSGQRMLKRLGLLERDDNPLFSAGGAAGLAADLALDPLNLIGVGEATGVGKALNLVRGGLKEAETVNQALKAGRTLADAGELGGRAVHMAELANRTGRTLEDVGMAGKAVDLASPLAQAGRKAVQHAREVGLPFSELIKPAANLGEAAARGEKALIGIGQHYDPFGLLRIGGKYNPVNLLPEIPALTAPLELPEAIAGKALVQGTPVLQGVSKAADVIGQTAPVRQIAQLFSKIPPGMEGQAAQAYDEAATAAAKVRAATTTEGAETANLLQQRLRDPDLLKPLEQPRAVQVGDDLADAVSGEVLAEGTPGLAKDLGLDTPETQRLAQYPDDLRVRSFQPQDLVPPKPVDATVRSLEDVAGLEAAKPEGIPSGVKSVAVDRGRIQELLDEGKTLPEAQRLASEEGAVQGVRAGPEIPTIRDPSRAGKAAGRMSNEEARAVQDALLEHRVAGAFPEQADFMRSLGEDLRNPPELPPSEAPTPEAFASEGPLDAIVKGHKKYQRKMTKWVVPEEFDPLNLTPQAGQAETIGAGLSDDLQAALDALPENIGIEEPKPVADPFVDQVHETAAAKPEPGSASAEQFKRLKQLEMNEKNLNATIRDLERRGVPTNSPAFQEALRTRKDLSVERFGLENEIRLGRPSPIGPRPTEAAVERETFRRQFDAASFEQGRIRNYLVRAGYGTSEAAAEASKLLPKEASPEVMKAIGDGLELGKTPAGEAGAIAQSLRSTYDEMFHTEQSFAVQTPGLKDPRLSGYAPHIPTAAGKSFFKGMAKNAEGRAELFKALQEARASKGVQNLAEGGLAEEFAQGAKNISERSEGAKQIAVPQYLRGEAERRLAELTPETRDWLEQKGLTKEFLTWDKLAQNTHESQIARLAPYKGLSINELNEVFKAHGAKGEVFTSDPAVQLFVRTKRHAVAKAANTLFEQLAAKVGREVPEHVNAISTHEPGIIQYQGHGFGIESVNAKLIEQGRPPVVFPDMATAKGLQGSITKLLNPEEAQPLLQWYDQVTRLFKSYVTKGFPAFHVRNHIGNQLQSFLEDVPLQGLHNEYANKLMAGQDFSVKLGDGSTATRDALRTEMQQQGVLSHGYFESEFGHAIEEPLKGQSSWNPLDPNNTFLKGAERASAGLAMGPGQLAYTGGAGAALKADGTVLEQMDRARHYLAKRMQGFAPEAAAESVKKALFDYGDLNDFEKNILGRAVYFYGYQRNVLPLALNAILTKPGAVHQMLELSAGGQGPDQGALPAHLPSFAREGLPSGLGKDAEGNPLVLWGIENPITAALQPAAGFSEGPQRGAEKLLANLNPILRMPLEAATNRRFFFGKSIDESNKAPHYVEDLPDPIKDALGVRATATKDGGTRYTMDPMLLYALENSPLGRLSGTASKITDDKKGLGEQLVNFLTGAHISSIDEEKEAYYAKKNAAMKRLQDLEREGKVEARQIPIFTATDVGKEDPEVKAALKASRAKASKKP